jgi:hypothetical protein
MTPYIAALAPMPRARVTTMKRATSFSRRKERRAKRRSSRKSSRYSRMAHRLLPVLCRFHDIVECLFEASAQSPNRLGFRLAGGVPGKSKLLDAGTEVFAQLRLRIGAGESGIVDLRRKSRRTPSDRAVHRWLLPGLEGEDGTDRGDIASEFVTLAAEPGPSGRGVIL